MSGIAARTTSLAMIAAVAASALLCAAPRVASAQDADPAQPDPRMVALRCVEDIHGTAHQARSRIGDTSRRTVRFIGFLESQGAPDPVLAMAGAEGRDRIVTIASHGADLINARTRRCLGVLRELGAEPELAQKVLEARARSLNSIGESAERGLVAIARSLGFGGADEAGAPDTIEEPGAALIEA